MGKNVWLRCRKIMYVALIGVCGFFVGQIFETATRAEAFNGSEERLVTTYMAEEGVVINEENFPDEAFRNVLLTQYDRGNDGVLTSELNETYFYLLGMGIRDLTGIEYFTKLEVLDCSVNSLESLDVSGLKSLRSLICDSCELTGLNVSGLTSLEVLNCGNNALTELDAAGLTSLMQISCYNNRLSSLDLSGLESLERLACGSNSLSSLDVRDCNNLMYLGCSDNQLESLDVSNLAYLQTLECYNNNLSELALSGLTSLQMLYCYSNQLTSLDVSDLTALQTFSCSSNELVDLDVSGLQALSVLDCRNNNLECLSVSDVPALRELDCSQNKLVSLDVSGVPLLTTLYCNNNGMESLNVSGLTSLENLICSRNKLSSLEVSGLSSLRSISCQDNNLTSLDVRGLEHLYSLTCSMNLLEELKVEGLESLQSLTCSINMLSELDASGLTSLTSLNCHTNQLRSLNLNGTTALTSLICYSNYLSSLNVRSLTMLQKLECYDNKLERLDVSALADLKRLVCSTNCLSCLDVSKCTKLEYLEAGNNCRKICVDDVFVFRYLPGFDSSKASGWVGAEYDAITDSLNNVSEVVYYTYDCGGGFSNEFSFEVDNFIDVNGDEICDNCGWEMVELTDPIEAFVTRMYQVILEREPDAGSSTWINGLKDGSFTGVRVADGFVLSDEMLNKDISNEDFVKILYRAFFGREADADGLKTWTDLLDAGCKKKYVFAGFANSTEFGALCAEAGIVQGRAAEYLADCQTGLSEQDYKVWCFVERMYTEVLGRTADEAGVRTWVGVLQDGSYTGVRVADGFLMSDEFLAKEMTKEEYVQIMYRAFFGRDADAEGMATWTNALATGWTKKRVFAGFANSNEFGVLCEQAGIEKGIAEEQ